MPSLILRALSLTGFAVSGLCAAVASCPSAPAPKYPASVADGYSSSVVVNGLTQPRGIAFDSAGHLLVVQRSLGVQAYTLNSAGSCVSVANQKRVISDANLNHGIALSNDGKTLYVSSVASVFAYAYDPATATVTTPGKIIITNMTNNDHVTRTLTVSAKAPNTILVARGSNSNIDPLSADINNGIAQVKAFSTVATSVLNYASEGLLMGWGLRNEVGVAEHPKTGGVWGVENSLDDITRYGTQFSENNPAEELNYFGTILNNNSPNRGANFGYPQCVAAWNQQQVPNALGLQTGEQFAVQPTDAKYNDAYCKANTVAPRLAFKAHMAPLDIKFTADGNTAWVSFHGSFDRSTPAGYMVSRIAFRNGQPVAVSTSKTALRNIVTNNNTKCTGSTCFRPVGIAIDKAGRVFFSSDATGEIFVIVQG